jgi:hypothetical protein
METLKKLWNLFWSAVPAWVIKLQLLAGLVVGYGITLAATKWTGGLTFLNGYAPEMITFGTIAGLALQLVQKVETVVLQQGDSVTNTAQAPISVDIPMEQAPQAEVSQENPPPATT